MSILTILRSGTITKYASETDSIKLQIKGKYIVKTPLVELTALPHVLLAGGEGARCPLPQNHSPALSLRRRISALQASRVPLKRNSEFPGYAYARRHNHKGFLLLSNSTITTACDPC